MMATISLALSHVIDWEAIIAFADEYVIRALQANESFTSAQTFRHQIYESCRILHIEHRPAALYSMIGRLFGIAKNTVRYHYNQYTDHQSMPRLNGWPSILSPAEHENLIHKIVGGYTERKPWTMAEIMCLSQYSDLSPSISQFQPDPAVRSLHIWRG
jgi:hypothetical protein